MKDKLIGVRHCKFLQTMFCIFVLSTSVLVSAGEEALIQIDKQPGSNPWSNLDFPDANVDFQFAVIGDNTGGAYPGVFDAAMTKLNLIQPEFVLSVGVSDLLDAVFGRAHRLRISSLEREQPLGRALGSRPIRLKELGSCSRLVSLRMARSWVRMAITESRLARS